MKVKIEYDLGNDKDNKDYMDAVAGSRYGAGLIKVRELARDVICSHNKVVTPQGFAKDILKEIDHYLF